MAQGQPSDTCGDHGGEKANGEPCQRAAGWGTDQDTGKCKNHRPEADEKMNDTKKEFLEEFTSEVQSLKRAAKKVGISQATVWRWRQDDPEFNKDVEEAKNKQEQMRVEKVEDSLFRRAVSGDATGAETIFWLKNRAPDRWSDEPEVEINNEVSQVQNQGQVSMSKLGDAMDALDDGLDEVRQEEAQAQKIDESEE